MAGLSVIPDDTSADPVEAAPPSTEAPIANQTPVQEPEKPYDPDAPDEPEVVEPEAAEKPEASKPEAKPEKAAKPSKGKGEIEIVLRPNSPLNEQHVADITEFAQAHGMNQEQAQALADAEAQREADLAEYNQMQADDWYEEVASDKEIGGEFLDRTQQRAKKALSSFWDNDFITMLKSTGMGNNPGFVRGLEKLGARLSEPQHIARGPESVQGGPPSWEDLFPNSPRP